MTVMSWDSVQPGDLDWQRLSRCQRADPELFHPEATKRSVQEEQADQVAADWCRRCPVVAACRSFAEDRGAVGVWGGTLRSFRGTESRVVELPSMQPPTPPPPLSPLAPPSKLDVCGSDAGYAKHRRRAEMPCGECKAAHARVDVARRRRLAEAKETAA